MTEDKPNCDMNDLMCQMTVLAHLKGIEGALGSDRFKTELPDLVGLAGRLPDTIAAREKTLEESLRSCGLLSEQETASFITPEEITSLEPEQE